MRATIIIIAFMLFLGWYGVTTIDALLFRVQTEVLKPIQE